MSQIGDDRDLYRRYPAEERFFRLQEKVQRGEALNDEELMEFIILPLSYRKKEDKEGKIRELVELAAQITDRGQQLFTLTGLLIFTDKIIDRETASRIRRMIEMTQVAQIFEEEKQQALQQALDQAAKKFEKELQKELEQQKKKYKKKEQQEKRKLEEEKQKEIERFKKEQEEKKQRELEQAEKQTVRKMLQRGYPSEEIASLVSGYSKEAVERLWEEMQQESFPKK